MALVGESTAVRKRRPAGSLAWQQYRVTLASGLEITLGFSLADPRDKTMALIGKQHEAAHLGLLVILDDPESLDEVVLWFQQSEHLTLVSQNGDTLIGAEVRALLPRYFAVFFDEVKDLAPDLAKVRLAVPRTGDRSLH